MDSPVNIEHRGALAEITLNRPNVLNALNDEMRHRISGVLPEFARDPEVYALIFRSSSGRAFCSGGDVRELTVLARSDPALADASIGHEYRMNWLLECFTKPTVSLIDGLVVGSGVGLMLYGTHRVAGEGFRFAMPETALGLFPDVGAGCVLAKMPGQMGRYLGLTGRTIGRSTAYRLGIVTHCVAASDFEEVTGSLEAADTVDPLLDELHRAPEEPDQYLAKTRLIEDIFSASTLAGIFDRLMDRVRKGADDAEWCSEVLRELEGKSPLSLHVTFRHLAACRELSLRDVLMLDYRLAVSFLRGNDLHEGVRALLIDKDKSPRWAHETFKDVGADEIEEYFLELGENALHLPTREEMQVTRG